MRNWPYAYSAGSKGDSPVKGKFDVAPLPGAGWQQARRHGRRLAAGGLQVLEVRTPRSSTSATWPVPRSRPVAPSSGSFVPTIQAVAERPEVHQVMPYLKTWPSVDRVTARRAVFGERYNKASTAFFQGVNQILGGQDAAAVLPNVQRQTRAPRSASASVSMRAATRRLAAVATDAGSANLPLKGRASHSMSVRARSSAASRADCDAEARHSDLVRRQTRLAWILLAPVAAGRRARRARAAAADDLPELHRCPPGERAAGQFHRPAQLRRPAQPTASSCTRSRSPCCSRS